ncbi:hypothetical protein ACFWB1_23770 [Streptomyces goshikiensis]|uniref:hypothetical protein n=1 Tax=Streptomyces goshikiensis TaxID=1942 RepID=UPI0036A8AF2C
MHGAGAGRSPKSEEVVHSTAEAVQPVIESMTPLQRDVTYDHETGQARMAVDVLLPGGERVRTTLVIAGPALHWVVLQLERAIRSRERGPAETS